MNRFPLAPADALDALVMPHVYQHAKPESAGWHDGCSGYAARRSALRLTLDMAAHAARRMQRDGLAEMLADFAIAEAIMAHHSPDDDHLSRLACIEHDLYVAFDNLAQEYHEALEGGDFPAPRRPVFKSVRAAA